MTDSHEPETKSGIDHTPVDPRSVRAMWQNLAAKNKPAATVSTNLAQKPTYAEFSQQTSPLLPSHNPMHRSENIPNKEEGNIRSELKQLSQNHEEVGQNAKRQSIEPEITILDSVFSEPTYEDGIRSSYRASIPKIRKTTSEVMNECGRISEESQVVSVSRDSQDIDILKTGKFLGKEEEQQLLKEWEQDILDELELEKYLLQSSIKRSNKTETQKKPQPQTETQAEVKKESKIVPIESSRRSSLTLRFPNKFLVFPPVLDHHYQHQFEITRSLGYVFSQIINKTHKINPVGYQKWCQDLIMDDHINHHLQSLRHKSPQPSLSLNVTKRSMPVSVIFSFAVILSIPVPEQIQSLQLHQFVTIAEITSSPTPHQ